MDVRLRALPEAFSEKHIVIVVICSDGEMKLHEALKLSIQ